MPVAERSAPMPLIDAITFHIFRLRDESSMFSPADFRRRHGSVKSRHYTSLAAAARTGVVITPDGHYMLFTHFFRGAAFHAA